MGIAFDAPLRAPAAAAARRGRRRCSTSRRGAGWARADDARRSRSGSLLLAALVGALAGLQLVLPVDRLAVVFVVDLSDSVGHAGPRGGARVRARGARGEAGRGRRGDRRVRRRRARGAAPVGARRDRPHRVDAGHATRPTSAPRSGSPAALFPDDAQKRIVLLSDGNDTTGSGPVRGGARRGARDPGRDAPGRPRRPRRGPRRAARPPRRPRASASRSRSSADITSTVAQPATVRLFVNGELAEHPARRPRRRARTGSSFTFTPKDSGLPALPGRRRGGPRHVQPERPRGREHDRQGRAAGCSSSRATRTSRPQLVDGARDRAPGRGHRHPRGACRRTSPGSPTTTRSSSSTSRGCGSRTRRWPRSRSTSATSGAGS